MNCRALYRGLAGVGLCLATLSAMAVLPAVAAQPAPATAARIPEPPRVLFKDLFAAVQTAKVFPDSKTFADASPKSKPSEILAK